MIRYILCITALSFLRRGEPHLLSGQAVTDDDIFLERSKYVSSTPSQSLPLLHRFYYEELGRSYLLERKKNDNRRPSFPHLTGDALRYLSDHLYDETKRADASYIMYGESVFVKGDMLGIFFESCHEAIKYPYVLITHNSDNANPGMYKNKLDDAKILAWFVQNADVTHPKLHPVPIGIANANWEHGSPSHFMKQLPFTPRPLSKARNILLYIGYFGATNPLRQNINKQLQFGHYSGKISHTEYLNYLSRSKFVVSPPGNGADCHRTWEAILMGAIPIVWYNPALSSLYANLPVLIVPNASAVTENLLHSYILPDKIDYNALWARTHFEKIQHFKQKHTLSVIPHSNDGLCSVVVVHLGMLYNRYLPDCIAQVRKLVNCSIYIYVDEPSFYLPLADALNVYILSKLKPSSYLLQFQSRTALSKGFWRQASERIIIVHMIVKEFNLTNVFHIESDNLVYFDLSLLLSTMWREGYQIGIPCDNGWRCIPGFVYIRDDTALETVVRVMINNTDKNDMESFSIARHAAPHLVKSLPMVPSHLNANKFPCIFDAAALGQFIGGIDPIHRPGNTSGFINKEADYQVNKMVIDWRDGVPYADGHRVCNLHIHSKQLNRWMTD